MTHFTDIAWLAKQTRAQIEKSGWRSYEHDPKGSGICLFVAANRVAMSAAPSDPSAPAVARLFEALGFKSMTEGMIWNDEQESVEAIYERLERVK